MKKGIRLSVCLLAVFMLMTAMTGCGFGKQGVGIVYLEKVMDSAKIKEFNDQVIAKQKEFSDNVTKDKATMKEEELSKKYDEAYKKLQAYQQEVGKQANDAIKQVCEEIAKQKDLSVVLNKEAVVSNGVDITDDVVQKLGGATPQAQQGK